ncbi:MAG: hypothetical protein ABIL09_20875 [Gemmatimonadota bacterium]
MPAILAQADGGSYLGFQQSTNLGPLLAIAAVVAAAAGLFYLLRVLRGGLRRRGRRGAARADADGGRRRRLNRRDQMREYAMPVVDMDVLITPPSGRARPIPEELPPGSILVSQRLGVKCLLLEDLAEVGRQKLKEVCARKLKPSQAVYLPMGTQVLRDEILHQGREFAAKIRKGTLFLSAGGHPNAYLLDELNLPLRRELTSNPQVLVVTEATAQRYLQQLVDIPTSFALMKEDLLFDTSDENIRTLEKGTLVISRSGALVGLMLEDYQLPHKGPISDLDALFQLRTNYERYPLETLIQRSSKAGGRPLEIAKGTFIFSSAGKVYFAYKEGMAVDEATLRSWSKRPQIYHPCLLEVSKVKTNSIGGPGQVISQDELNYIRDVFRQAGTSNIRRETLLLDRNVFYKFTKEFPYAQSGKFRGLLGKGVVMLNSASKGTFSIELGGSKVELTDLDLQAVRKHLLPEGRMLIKIGTQMRIRDERGGDWVYEAKTNLFYPYETFTRAYMEEFIPESVRFDHRESKLSCIIGPQENPREDDVGGAGEPIGDLLAIVNGQLFQLPGSGQEPRTVFILDGTLFHWKGRLYRVNEEIVYRPHEVSEKLVNQDLEALAQEWKIHPAVEDAAEHEVPVVVEDDEEDLENLPFDTGSMR